MRNNTAITIIEMVQRIFLERRSAASFSKLQLWKFIYLFSSVIYTDRNNKAWPILKTLAIFQRRSFTWKGKKKRINKNLKSTCFFNVSRQKHLNYTTRYKLPLFFWNLQLILGNPYHYYWRTNDNNFCSPINPGNIFVYTCKMRNPISNLS